ncbi:DNA ligase [Rhodoferax ferrireducens]|uniref:DNA ligase n=1 Tax=Rhodoferax ferrireducens TaxID=192843 RepID=UPI000E0DF842|nr:DNA ligase [Rhodoferax ferrireducens]
MAYRPVGRQATHLALLLGSAFFTVVAPAAATETVAVQAPPVLPPALMLGKNWQAGLDPAAFLVSEKLDGVRAFWDGHTLRFRSGRRIAAPDWFTAALPATPLDGELWLGRGRFDRLSGIVRRSIPVEAEWRELRYMIFDLPGSSGRFGERAARVVSVVGTAGVPWLQAIEQAHVPDRATLQRQLLQLTRDGAEGLVLHRADAEWTPGRSDALRKLKPLPDEDARVMAYLPGKGRHAGRMGALMLEMANGQRFALGTGFNDVQRDTPPPVGSFVTYRYRDRTPNGLPRFASFLRVREAE